MSSNGWKKASLESLCRTIYRYPTFYGFEARSHGVPVLRGEHLQDYRLIEGSSGYSYVSEQVSEQFPNTRVELHDVVMAVRGTVGNFALVDEAHIGAQISPNLIRISADPQKVDKKYFFYALGPAVQRLISSSVQSQALPSIAARDIKKLQIFLPPSRSEQERIVEILEQRDLGIQRLQHLIGVMQQRKRGLMQVLLTGKKRFTEYANLAWRSAPLADYVASARKGKPASLNDAGRGVPYIGSAAFDGDYTSHTDDPSAVRCSAKDVLLLWDGEYAGKSTTGHVGAVGSTVVAITLKPGLDPRYLHNLLLFHNQRIRSVREGSGIPHMPSDFFTWFKPHLPPIEEQRTIASVLSTADEEMRMLEAQLEAYELQKRGLMQQLFTGEKRVNVDISEAVPA